MGTAVRHARSQIWAPWSRAPGSTRRLSRLLCDGRQGGLQELLAHGRGKLVYADGAVASVRWQVAEVAGMMAAGV